MPITGAFEASKALLMAEIESIGATLNIELLGQIIMRSASLNVSIMPGAGLAFSVQCAPRKIELQAMIIMGYPDEKPQHSPRKGLNGICSFNF